MQEVSVTEARARFAELVDQVRYRGEGVLLTKSGKPAAALVPARVYEEWQQVQVRGKRALDEIWELNLGEGMTEEEVMEWAVQTVREVRQQRAQAPGEKGQRSDRAGR